MPATKTHLSSLLARDAMRHPIVSCDPSLPVTDVASLMGSHRIHAVVVTGVTAGEGGERFVWAVVSDLDLVRAALLADASVTAGEIAGTEALTVEADDDLVLVSAALSEHSCSHAIVVENERPVGVISTLDIATAMAS